jgi:hypothetical protein
MTTVRKLSKRTKLRPDVKHREDEAERRLFVLQIVQPGLAGLMDVSASILAPVSGAKRVYGYQSRKASQNVLSRRKSYRWLP